MKSKRYASEADWSSRWTELRVSLHHLSDKRDY